jgi:hypothetical protein
MSSWAPVEYDAELRRTGHYRLTGE